MTIASPPRLKYNPELGPLLQAAEPTPISPDRLAANGAAVRSAIVSGAGLGGVALKVGLLGALIAGGVVAERRLIATGDGARPRPAAAVVAAPVAAPAPAIPDRPSDPVAAPASPPLETSAAVSIAPSVAVGPAPGLRRAPPPPAPARPAPVASESRAVVPALSAPPPTLVAPTVAAASPPSAEPQPSAPSSLPAQLGLYEAARAARGDAAFAVGLAHLDELLTRFPTTMLRADAELTRAELLALAGRLAEAGVALEALARDPAHRGRRAEILRLLSDVRRRQGDDSRRSPPIP